MSDPINRSGLSLGSAALASLLPQAGGAAAVLAFARDALRQRVAGSPAFAQRAAEAGLAENTAQ